MKKTNKKLGLNKTTISNLSANELDNAKGGIVAAIVVTCIIGGAWLTSKIANG
ncbi:MAG: hypothetical protein GY765_41400 [bacterium]|nr:hypothetical protein [bacterium]